MMQLNEWQVECLRCSVFPNENTFESGSNLWSSLVGSTPDFEHRDNQRQISTVEGSWRDLAQLRLDIQRTQMDWRAIVDVRNVSDDLPSIGSYGDVKSSFQLLMQRWLTTECPRANRIAFGAILLLPRCSMVAVYDTLNNLLPSVHIDAHNTWDFNYRINRKKNSSSAKDGLQINSISNWSAVEIINAQVELPGHGASPKPLQIQNSKHLCRLELDINTVPEHSVDFDNKQMETVFKELVDLGTKIAIEGDLPNAHN